MTETNDLPVIQESTAPNCSCKGLTLKRAIIYTPVILTISGLGAIAMFPRLADKAVGTSASESKSSCTSGNPNCPIQMLIKAFSSPAKQEIKQQPATSTEQDSQLVTQLEAFSCCPSSRCLVPTTTASPAEGAIAASDEPTDALAAVEANQSRSADPQSASN